MDFILGAVSDLLRTMAVVLGGWSFPADLADSIDKFTPYLQKANMLIPISAAMTVFALWIALQAVLMAYYWVTRTLNLVRGAG